MSRILKLTQISFKLNFSILRIKNGKHNAYNFFIPMSIMATLLLLLVQHIRLINNVFHFFERNNSVQSFLPIAFFLLQMLLIFVGGFFLINSYFYANDFKVLCYLPYKPLEILFSKYLAVMFICYSLMALIASPILIIYGLNLRLGVLYWLKAILVILIFPIVPMTLVAIFVSVLIKILQHAKHRSKLLVSILVAVFVIYFIFSAKYFDVSEAVDVSEFFLIIGQRMHQLSPNIRQVALSLGANGMRGVVNILVLGLISVVTITIFACTLNVLFKKGIYIQQEHHKVKRSKSKMRFKVKSPIHSYFIKETRMFFRKPVYIVNGLAIGLISPMITPLAFSIQGFDTETSEQIRQLVNNESILHITTFIALTVLVLVASFNVVASSSISREGKYMWISRVIPVPIRDQVYAKALFATFTAALGIILNCIVFKLVFDYALIRIVVIFCIAIIYAFLYAGIGIVIDVVSPKLDWNNEYEAIKQNLNVVFAAIICFGLSYASFLFVKNGFENGKSEVVIYSILTSSVLILNYLTYFLIIKKCRDKFLVEN